jgi:uncharacterized membrane protein
MLATLLAVLAAATNATSAVLQRKANLREVEAQRTGWAGLVDLLRQPLWLAGIGAVIVSFLLQAAALAVGELSQVQPLLALDLPLSLLLASAVFHVRLGTGVWVDIGVMTCGIAVFLFALHPSGRAPDRPSGLDWALAAGTTAGVVALLAVVGFAATGTRRAALLGVASGICFALTAVFISVALADGMNSTVLMRWQTYLVPVAGIAAVLLLQEGLQAGPLVAVQPGVTLIDPVVAVLLGVLLLGEEVRTGPWIIPEVAGAAAVAWGALRLIRSPVGRAMQDMGQARDGAGPATGTAPPRTPRAARRDPC